MDEIFDRIKNRLRHIKTKRQYLIISLIIAELIGIFTLIWFLREPLIQKYFTTPPKAYSVVVMNNNSRYLVSNGDLLAGKTIPHTKVVTLITPGKIRQTLYADSAGDWRYQIPASLSEGKYQFSVGYFDKSDNLTFFKTYKLRSQSNNKIELLLNRIRSFFNFSISKAQAQDAVGEGQAELQIESESNSETESPQDPPAFPSPESYNITITSLGAETATLQPSQVIYPQSIVYDQNGEWIPENENLSIDYALESETGESFNVTPGEDCYGINTCSRQIPPEVPYGNYKLVAILNTGAGQIISPQIDLAIGQSQNTPSSETDGTVFNTLQGICSGEVCPMEPETTVVPLAEIYNFTPSYNDFGQALNIAGDCGENCKRPAFVIQDNYLQQDIIFDDLPQIQNNSDLESIISCFKETRNNPSSMLGFVASVTTLHDAFSGTPTSPDTVNQMFREFLLSNSLNCSVNGYSTELFSGLSQNLGLFSSSELVSNAGFDNLESYYQEFERPILVETRFNNTDPHYALIIAISDNYVWYIDPLDPGYRNYALRITKDAFTNNFFTGNYWQLAPAESSSLSFRFPISGEGNYTVTPEDCMAKGTLFFEASKDGVPVTLPGYAIDPETNLTTSWFDLRNYIVQNEQFCILGKYSSADNPQTYQYKVVFDDPNSQLYNRGFFAIPIAKINIVRGDMLINKLAVEKNTQIGVRVNLAHDEEDPAKVFDNVDELGIGTVRILIDEARPEEMIRQFKLIDMAADRGYFIVIQYQPGQRPHRSPRLTDYRYIEGNANLSDFEFDKRVTQGRLGYVINHLIYNKRVPVNRFAIELGNEANVRWSGTEGKYFQDCAQFRQQDGVFARDENGKVIVDNLDPTSDQCNPYMGGDNISNVYNAFADFIDSSSSAIWDINPNIKIILGALYLQEGGKSGDINKFSQENYSWYLGAIELVVGENRFSNFDYSIHGYHVWNTQNLDSLEFSEWEKKNDGLGAAYYSLTTNEVFRKYKSPTDCHCVWATEFGIDQIGQDMYQLIDALDAGKTDSGNINSIIIHEFNGEGADNQGTIYRLWSDETGQKYPAFNLLQYYNLFDNIYTAPENL